jgi:hypothetical protein
MVYLLMVAKHVIGLMLTESRSEESALEAAAALPGILLLVIIENSGDEIFMSASITS